MGAVTVSIVKREPDRRMLIADVTFSGTYAAGGDTYTLAQFEAFSKIDGIQPMGPAVASATTGYNVMPDLTNKKLRLIGGAASGVAGAETGTADQSATVVRVVVYKDDPNI